MKTYSDTEKFFELCRRAKKLGYEISECKQLARAYIKYFYYEVPVNGEILLFEDWCKAQ